MQSTGWQKSQTRLKRLSTTARKDHETQNSMHVLYYNLWILRETNFWAEERQIGTSYAGENRRIRKNKMEATCIPAGMGIHTMNIIPCEP